LAYPAKRKKEKRKREVKGNIEAAQELAFRFLSYRSRSSEEVRQKLSQAGFAPSAIKGVIARLEELKYLNDYDYARASGRSCVEHKCWGPARIRDSLLKKGVAPAIITSVVQELADEHDFSLVARRALEARFSPAEMHKLTERKTRQRLIDYLVRKGFSWSIIADVIKIDQDTFI
jgi:regulatory protein